MSLNTPSFCLPSWCTSMRKSLALPEIVKDCLNEKVAARASNFILTQKSQPETIHPKNFHFEFWEKIAGKIPQGWTLWDLRSQSLRVSNQPKAQHLLVRQTSELREVPWPMILGMGSKIPASQVRIGFCILGITSWDSFTTISPLGVLSTWVFFQLSTERYQVVGKCWCPNGMNPGIYHIVTSTSLTETLEKSTWTAPRSQSRHMVKAFHEIFIKHVKKIVWRSSETNKNQQSKAKKKQNSVHPHASKKTSFSRNRQHISNQSAFWFKKKAPVFYGPSNGPSTDPQFPWRIFSTELILRHIQLLKSPLFKNIQRFCEVGWMDEKGRKMYRFR